MLDTNDDPQKVNGTTPAREPDGQTNAVEPTTDEDVEPWWRGVFAPEVERKVLFTKEFDLDEAKLPRWQPYIHIEPNVESDDDE